MTSQLFASQSDFSSRATETIVFLRGEPLYARAGSKEFHLQLLDFPATNKTVHANVHVDTPELYMGAARLGLFNYGGAVHLPMRTPARRYRYGTPPEYLTSTSMGRKTHGEVFSPGFRAMLLNEYPTVQQALAEIKKSSGSLEVAISRHFWLKENTLGLSQLHFKDLGPVLWVAPGGGITFVEKTKLSAYLTQCSRSLSGIIEELRTHVV